MTTPAAMPTRTTSATVAARCERISARSRIQTAVTSFAPQGERGDRRQRQQRTQGQRDPLDAGVELDVSPLKRAVHDVFDVPRSVEAGDGRLHIGARPKPNEEGLLFGGGNEALGSLQREPGP